MSQQTINVGAAPNDGTGTPLRTAFQYTNSNFTELYTALGGGAGLPGATTQVIFNDGGTNLAGDAGLTYNKTTDTLSMGAATITGDLTVDTNTLKVDSANNRVGVNNATPGVAFHIGTTGGTNRFAINTAFTSGGDIQLRRGAFIGFSNAADSGNSEYLFANAGALDFGINGSTAMTLNSTGLGVGGSPLDKFTVVGSSFLRGAAAGVRIGDGGGYGFISAYDQTLSTAKDLVLQTGGGNVGIGVTPSAWNGNKAIQIPSYGSYAFGASGGSIPANAYYDGAWKYIANGYATKYDTQQGIGAHLWYTAPSGTAGNAITFTQAMTLDASGNLLVGTTSLLGGERLIVEKATAASYLARFINSNPTVDTFGITVKYSASAPNDANHNFLYVEDNVNVRAQIYANGGLANYSANNVNLSDARTKTDIKPLASYWNKIKALELVTFKYKDQTHDDDNIGLISQQVESVAPELVSNEGFGETPADGVPLKTIYTTDLYHAAIKALQEAMTRIEALEAKLA